MTSYFKTGIRNLLKRKEYALLNIAGLAIGIVCCLLIFHYVSYERSFESFNKNAAQIVRLRVDAYRKGKLAWQSATSYPAIAPTMKKDFPEVEDYCRLIDAEGLLANEERNIKFNETKGYFADASAINMMDIHLLKGNAANALDAPDKMVVSETMAKKYFNSTDVLGRRLTSKGNYPGVYEIAGVFKDYPSNSHLIINYLISYSTLKQALVKQGDKENSAETQWGWYDFYSYIKLKPGTDYKALQAKLPAFANRYMNDLPNNKNANRRNELYLIPEKDIHLYSNFNQEAEVNGDGQSVSFLYMIAFFIITIAWVNYINLATARSVERAKEVGVRKVMGASRGSLIMQFMAESFLLNITALIIAVLLVLLLAPAFHKLVGVDIHQAFILPSQYWLGFLAMFVGGTVLSGIYPALILSAFQPIVVLKGMFKSSGKGVFLRKGLIVGQFATSVILIAGTIIVYQQVSYMRNQKLGVNINQTLVMDGAGSVKDSLYQNSFQPFKNELLKLGVVKSVTASSNVMGQEIYWTNGNKRLTESNDAFVTLYNMGIDYDFIPAYELKVNAGRNFSKDFPSDNHAVLLNEKAVEVLGFKNAGEAVNQKITSDGDTVLIAGVVANYHHQGLQKPIDPMVFRLITGIRNAYALKMETGNMQKNVATVQSIWSKYFPADPFNYYFLDDLYDKQYKSNEQFGKVFGLFAFLAILIACFGLLGVSAYNVLQRTKEIGIRKVLGASVPSLLFLLSKEFLLLVGIAFIMAIPVTWLAMNSWLHDFAYRINIQWWIFLIAGIIALLIAVITISVQSVKAALANPVRSLRSE